MCTAVAMAPVCDNFGMEHGGCNLTKLTAAKDGEDAFAMSRRVLSEDELQRWDDDGVLILRNVLPASITSSLVAMSDELVALDGQNGPWLHHYEETGGSGNTRRQICRVENYCRTVKSWRNVCFNYVFDIVKQVCRQDVVLFKDKLNFKGPGGAGFRPHQDATAYDPATLASWHISVLVPIDAMTQANGCLQVALGENREGGRGSGGQLRILPNIKGVIDADIDAKLVYTDVLCGPGDIVLFDSYVPHKSNGNNTLDWRRSAYLTFNTASEGDHHEEYYRKKAEVFAAGTGGSISINDDFMGKIVH